LKRKRLRYYYKEFFVLIPKFLRIFLYSIIGSIKKNKTTINYFLTVDLESSFINTIKLQNNSYERDIHDSSKKIAKLANKYGLKVIFFIDYPEIEIFHQRGKPIYDLIFDLVKEGHSIQLHIHPSLINNEKSPDISFYSLKRIREMVYEGCNTIENITGKRPIAFRAGGYSVGQWSKIYSALVKEGILIDSSTFSGAKNLHGSTFDFYNLENMKPYFPSPNSLKHRSNTGLIEFPITTVIKSKNNLEASLLRFDPTNYLLLLKFFTNYLLSKHNDVYINMIYHSKHVYNNNGSIGKSYNNLELFLKFLNKKNFISPTLESITE
jgi:hypothetical protein